MDTLYVIKYSFNSISKSFIVAIVTLIGMLIGHSLGVLLGYLTSDTPIILTNGTSTLLFLSVIVLTAILIGELLQRINQPFKERVIFVFVYHYFFFHVLRAIDGFLSRGKVDYLNDLLINIVPSLVFALLVAFLWKPEQPTVSFNERLNEYVGELKKRNFLGRLVIGWICFIPIYYITSKLLAPFIEPFHKEIDYFVVNAVNAPSFVVVFLLKIILGLLFVFVLMPIFVLWTNTKASLLFWVGFPIFVQAAVYPSIVELWLPLGMRFPYLIKYTVITYLMAIIFVQLFFVPKENEVIEDQFKWMY